MKVKIIATGEILELEDGYAARLIEQEIATFVSSDTPAPEDDTITPAQLVRLAEDHEERITALEDQSEDERESIRTAIDAALNAAAGVDNAISDALDTVAIRETVTGQSVTLTYAGGKPAVMKVTIPATQSGTVITQPTIETLNVTFNSTAKAYALPVANNAGVLDFVGKKFTPYRLWDVLAEHVVQVGTTGGGVQYARISTPYEYCDANAILMCSHYTISGTIASGNIRHPANNTADFYVYDNSFTDLETAKALIEEMSLQILYKPNGADVAATMDDVSLTGVTTVAVDAGTLELKYNMNTKAYIDAAIAAAINA